MLFNDGNVDQTFSNLSNAQWHIHSLHLQLLLVIVFILDKEWHVNIYGLHTFLELYRTSSLCRKKSSLIRTFMERLLSTDQKAIILTLPKTNVIILISSTHTDSSHTHTSVCGHCIVARHNFEILKVSRLDVFLSEFYNIRVGAARSRQDSVHHGVVLPEEHRRVERLDKLLSSQRQ